MGLICDDPNPENFLATATGRSSSKITAVDYESVEEVEDHEYKM